MHAFSCRPCTHARHAWLLSSAGLSSALPGCRQAAATYASALTIHANPASRGAGATLQQRLQHSPHEAAAMTAWTTRAAPPKQPCGSEAERQLDSFDAVFCCCCAQSCQAAQHLRSSSAAAWGTGLATSACRVNSAVDQLPKAARSSVSGTSPLSGTSPGFLLGLPALHCQSPKVLQQRPLPPSVTPGPELVKVPALSHCTQPPGYLAAQINDLLWGSKHTLSQSARVSPAWHACHEMTQNNKSYRPQGTLKGLFCLKM